MPSLSGDCWRRLRRRQVKDEAGMDCGITTAEFHPDGIILGTGCQDTVVRVWEARQQKVPRPAAPCRLHARPFCPWLDVPSSPSNAAFRVWGTEMRQVCMLLYARHQTCHICSTAI